MNSNTNRDPGPATGTGLWCKRCGQPARLTGGMLLPPGSNMRRAVHDATRKELCAGGGRLILLTDENPVLRAEADALEAEFGRLFRISVRFGIFRAEWRERNTGAHYDEHNAVELRPRLRAALADPVNAREREAGSRNAGAAGV